jgi:hypothetical protein
VGKLNVAWPSIRQKQLEEVVRLRETIRGWKERPKEMGERMAADAIDQCEFALALYEQRLGKALKRGAEVEAGKLTEAVLRKPAASSRRLWRRWTRGKV